jgi:hypothetical protein
MFVSSLDSFLITPALYLAVIVYRKGNFCLNSIVNRRNSITFDYSNPVIFVPCKKHH